MARVLAGTFAYLGGGLLLFLVVERALSSVAAVVAVALAGVVLPLALTKLLTPVFKRLVPVTTFWRVLPGMAGFCGLVTVVALPLVAKTPVARALLEARTRHAGAGAVPLYVADALGRTLDPSVSADAGAPRDAGVLRDAAVRGADVIAAVDVSETIPVVPADVGAPGDVADVLDATDTPDITDVADVATGTADEGDLVVDVSPCTRPLQVLLGDLEGDTRDEVVVRCERSMHVFALSEGDFIARLRVEPIAPQGTEVELGAAALADMDGDGRTDVLVCERYVTPDGTTRGGAVRYVTNRGDGRFGVLADLDRLAGCGAVAVGDVTGDGQAELLVAHVGDARVASPNGDLTWYARSGHTWARRARLPLWVGPSAIALSDVSGDQIHDVVVAHGGDVPVVVLPGSRTGVRPMDASLRAPAMPDTTRASGRFDRDDAPDLALLDGTDAALRLLRSLPMTTPPLRAVTGEATVLPARTLATDAGAD